MSSSVTPFWTERFDFNPEQGTLTNVVEFQDLHKTKLVAPTGDQPARLVLREAYWGRWSEPVARSLLADAEGLPRWAVEALTEIGKTTPVLGACRVTIVGPGFTGEFTVPVDWGFIMGDVEENLEEKARVGRWLEQKTGLRVRFSQWDYPTDSAVYYVASR